MTQNKKIIAITGGIGSGKSAVLACVRDMGYATVSADEIAREIYGDERVLAETRIVFPDCVQGDAVDRKKLAETVFSDARARRRLEEITHPAIMKKLFARAYAGDGDIVFAEVPLLFEGGYAPQFDGVIVVMRPLRARIQAVTARDGLSEQEVLRRMQNQFDYEKNPLSGHTVLWNDGDLAALRDKTERILHEIFHIGHR